MMICLHLKKLQRKISIVDEDGNPILAGDEERRYFEGPWVHKYNGNYYLSYSTGSTHCIVYAMSKNPKGPYTFKGKILDPVIGWTLITQLLSSKINGIYSIMIVLYQVEQTTNVV